MTGDNDKMEVHTWDEIGGEWETVELPNDPAEISKTLDKQFGHNQGDWR